jgi:hypothetical protein
MSRPRFKTRKTEDPGQDPHWQDVMLPQHIRPVPHKRDPPDKSPPRTTNLRLARAPPDSDWGMGHDTRQEAEARAPPPRRVGERFPAPCKGTSWRPMQAASPDESLNAGLIGCTAIPSTSYPTLPSASFAEALKHTYDELKPRLRP